MSPVGLEREGDVAVIRLANGENRFHPELLDALGRALDEVEASDGPVAVVITGEGRFFSNGLDLDYLGTADSDAAQANLGAVYALFARMLGFPAFTVAAIGGHCFAAGAMLALSCDHRIMRADRGYFCLPEADLGMQFTAGMQLLITSRLAPPAAHEAMITARRYGGDEAVRAGLVHASATGDDLLPAAVALAQEMAGKPRATIGQMKRSLYAPAIATLTAQAQGRA